MSMHNHRPHPYQQQRPQPYPRPYPQYQPAAAPTGSLIDAHATHEEFVRRVTAADVLSSPEQLSWHASARNESVAQTELRFQKLLAGINPDDPPPRYRTAVYGETWPPRRAGGNSERRGARKSGGGSGDAGEGPGGVNQSPGVKGSGGGARSGGRRSSGKGEDRRRSSQGGSQGGSHNQSQGQSQSQREKGVQTGRKRPAAENKERDDAVQAKRRSVSGAGGAVGVQLEGR